MWLRARTANQKFKQNAQTQDTDDMQALSVLYLTQLEAISQLDYISWKVRGGGSEPSALHVSAEASATRKAAL